MSELDLWLGFDALEPENVRILLDVLRRRLPPRSEEEGEQAVARVMAVLDAELGLIPMEEEGDVEAAAVAPPEAVVIERAGRVVAEVAEEEEAEIGEPGPAAVVETAALVERAAPALRPAAPGAGTAMALDLPSEVWTTWGRLPFKPPSPSTPKAAKTAQVPVFRTSLGETAPVGDDSIERAVAPFLGNTVGTGKVPFPRLSVMLYARFCVEMGFWPEREAEIFVRYRVMHRAAREALDAHWREVLGARGEVRAAFERAGKEWEAVLRAQWGGGLT